MLINLFCVNIVSYLISIKIEFIHIKCIIY